LLCCELHFLRLPEELPVEKMQMIFASCWILIEFHWLQKVVVIETSNRMQEAKKKSVNLLKNAFLF
jgi:hypothetical protein